MGDRAKYRAWLLRGPGLVGGWIQLWFLVSGLSPFVLGYWMLRGTVPTQGRPRLWSVEPQPSVAVRDGNGMPFESQGANTLEHALGEWRVGRTGAPLQVDVPATGLRDSLGDAQRFCHF
jgi:hypothetical protein